jgi:hypothetical protein
MSLRLCRAHYSAGGRHRLGDVDAAAAQHFRCGDMVRVGDRSVFLRPAPATSARKIAVSAASRWQLRNCRCQHMATSHLGHLGCSTHQPAVAEAAVVHR